MSYAQQSSPPAQTTAKPKDYSYKYASQAAVEKYSKAGGKYNIEGLLQQYFVGLTAISLLDMRFKRLHKYDPKSYGNDCGVNVTPNPQLTIARAAGAAYLFGDVSANWTFRKQAVRAGCLAKMIKIKKEKKAESEGGPKAKTKLGEECLPFEDELKAKIDDKNDFQAIAFSSVKDVLTAQEKSLKKKIKLAKVAALGFATSATLEALNIKRCNAACVKSKAEFEAVRVAKEASFAAIKTELLSLVASAKGSGSPPAAVACHLFSSNVLAFEKQQKAKHEEEKVSDKAYKVAKTKKTIANLANLAATLYPIAGEFKKTAVKKKEYEETGSVKKSKEPESVMSTGYTNASDWEDPIKPLTKIWKDVYVFKKMYGLWKNKETAKKMKDYQRFQLREGVLITNMGTIEASLNGCRTALIGAVAQATAQSTATLGTATPTLMLAKMALTQSHQIGLSLGNYLARSFNYRYTPVQCCGGQGVGSALEKAIKKETALNKEIITIISNGTATAIMKAEMAKQAVKQGMGKASIEAVRNGVSKVLGNISATLNPSQKGAIEEAPDVTSGQQIVGSLPWLAKSGPAGFALTDDVAEVEMYKVIEKMITFNKPSLNREGRDMAFNYFESLLQQAAFDDISLFATSNSPTDTLNLIKEKNDEINKIMFHYKISLAQPINDHMADISDPFKNSFLNNLLDQFFIPSAHAGPSTGNSIKIALLIIKRIFQSIDTNHKSFQDKGWTALIQGLEKYLKMKDILEYSMVYGGLTKPRNRMLFWTILSGATIFSIKWTQKGLNETKKRSDFFDKKLKELDYDKEEKKDDAESEGEDDSG